MKLKLLVSLCLIINIFIANAQYQVSGQLVFKDSKPESILVQLYKFKDSSLVKTSLSDVNGKFEFDLIKKDSFYLIINQPGFQIYKSTLITFNENSNLITLEPISLLANNINQVKGIKVKAKTNFIEKYAEKTVVNPDALISSAGLNALEMLERAPGVLVDLNGNISLKGKQGVMIFIDDKPTYLSSADLSNYLKSIPASSIASIEIMLTPPAKYDAAGNAGIINIKMKKTITKGFNGGLSNSIGIGRYPRSNNSMNLNYRINKFNFFSQWSYVFNQSYQDLTIERNYYQSNGNLNSRFKQNNYIKKQNSNINGKIGVDYYLSKKSTIGFSIGGFNNHANNSSNNFAEIKNGLLELQSIVKAENPNKRKFKHLNYNLNYDLKIDSTGKNLSSNFDYLTYNSMMNQSLLSMYYNPDFTYNFKNNLVSDLPSSIQIISGKIDYLHPLKNGAIIETGVKSSAIKTDNTANFFDERNDSLFVNNDFSNQFIYNENINAAYINYSKSKNKWSLQSGLRYENTNIKGNQLGNAIKKDSSFIREFNNLFPTFFFSYKLDSFDVHQLGLSYGRRIDRPNYQDMNPFTYPMDRFTLYSGNPFLKPTFSNNIELSYTFKNKITTAINYSYTKNTINETIEQNTNIFYSRPGNIGENTNYGISVNGALNINKWWTLQFYTELTHQSFKSELYKQQLLNEGWIFFINPSNQFKINDNWNAELVASYQSSAVSAQFVTIPVATMNMAIAKKIMKKKATLKFSINDVFYTYQPGGRVKGLYNSDAKWLSYLDTNVYTIAFSYRFNKGNGLGRRKTGSSDEEKARVI